MSFQTITSSSRGAPSGSGSSQTAALRHVGWLADHQPQTLAGHESAGKQNAPPHEYTAQPSRPFNTNTLRSLATTSDDTDGITEIIYCNSNRLAPLVRPSSPSQSPLPSKRSSAPPPAKITGKRRSHSQDAAGPSSPSKRARTMKEKDTRLDGAAVEDSSFEALAIPQLVHIRAATPPPRPTLTNPDMVPNLGSAAPMLNTRQQQKAVQQYPSPGEDGDNTTHSKSDRPNARGGRDERADATMATRIAEVQRLKTRWEHLMEQFQSVDRTADPSADDTLEQDLTEIFEANQAWRDAERELLSPSSTSSPEEPSLASTTLPVPTVVHPPSLMEGMRKQYNVLFQYLDNILPELPPPSPNGGEVEAPAPDVAPSSEGIPPSASLSTSADPTADNATASTSGATAATTTFRFSVNDEAVLLAHASAQRYKEAIGMLPEDQQRLVLRRPAEIAAVREIHPRLNKGPKNKRKQKSNDVEADNRKVRTHIGANGVETELWVCRALFKVRKGCGGIEYLENPCGYPVGTKDSWTRHLKDVHLGRVRRDAA